jgi:hypothetical protein
MSGPHISSRLGCSRPVFRVVLVVPLAVVVAVAGTTAAVAASGSTGPASTASAHRVHGTAATVGDPGRPQPLSVADRNSAGANGGCPTGPYCSTRGNGTESPAPSGNGNGQGRAVGRPCAGCVGKADNKNPAGQLPGGSDLNAGYECDRNHGIGRTNPAHTGCASGSGGSSSGSGGGGECVPTTADHFCSSVLGVTVRRSARRPFVAVLGERFFRAPGALPFTGAVVGDLVGAGALTLLVGTCLLALRRRRF